MSAPDFERTHAELERAHERFVAVLSVGSATIQAFELLAALPDVSNLISARLQVGRGVRPSDAKSDLALAGTRVAQAVGEERERHFAIVRASALIAACGAFEYFVKAVFVDQAATSPSEAAARLAKTTIRIKAADVLGLPVEDQWHAIADRLLEQLGEQHPLMAGRVRQFLLDYTHLPESAKEQIEGVFAEVDTKRLNEAFLIRNSLVHNGGRTSVALARCTGRPVGELIDFKDGVTRFVEPLRAIGGHLKAIWLHL